VHVHNNSTDPQDNTKLSLLLTLLNYIQLHSNSVTFPVFKNARLQKAEVVYLSLCVLHFELQVFLKLIEKPAMRLMLVRQNIFILFLSASDKQSQMHISQLKRRNILHGRNYLNFLQS